MIRRAGEDEDDSTRDFAGDPGDETPDSADRLRTEGTSRAIPTGMIRPTTRTIRLPTHSKNT